MNEDVKYHLHCIEERICIRGGKVVMPCLLRHKNVSLCIKGK